VLDVAAGEARRMKHNYVGTEHVALALTRINSNLASEALAKLGFDAPKAEAALRQNVKRGRPQQRRGGTRWSRVKRVVSLPWNVYVRKSLGHPRFVTNPYPLYRWL